jgi:hypothetical protein
MNRLVVAQIAVAALTVGALLGRAEAANTSSALALAGVGEVRFSLEGTTPTVDELDPGTNAFKRDAVVACVVSGQAVKMLVRLQKASNGVFVDVCVSDTDANLSTLVTAMNLSSRSHPSPTKDAIDTAILAAAAAD